MGFKFKFCGVKFTHNHNNSTPCNPPTPPELIQQRQDLLEAARQLEIEREKQIKLLRDEAQGLMTQTRHGLDNVSQHDIKTLVDCNTTLKKKDAELQEYKEKIDQIKKTLLMIAKGDCNKINELLDNDLFNEIFPNFDFKSFAVKVGNPAIIKYISDISFIKTIEERNKQQLSKINKEREERAHVNLNPKFEPLIERPFLERVSGVFAFHQSQSDNKLLQDTCKSLSELKQFWKYSKENGDPDLPDASGRFYTPADNITYIIQNIINQYFKNRLPDPKNDFNDLIKALAIAMVPAILLTSKHTFYTTSNSDKKNEAELMKNNIKELYKSSLHEYNAKRLLLGGIVRMLSEKGNYGENIALMMIDARDKYFNPIMDHVDTLLKIVIKPLQERRFSDLISKKSLMIQSEWIYLVQTYLEITQSGQYPLGDARILIEAQARLDQFITDFLVSEQEIECPLKIRSIGALFYQLSLNYGLKWNDTKSYNFVRMLNKIDLNKKENREGEQQSQIVEDLLNQVIDERPQNQFSIDKALSLAGLIIKKTNHEWSNDELADKLLASFTAGLVRKTYRNQSSNEEIFNLYKLLHAIASYNVHKFEAREQLSNFTHDERHHRNKIDQLGLKQYDIEIADLMHNYAKVCRKSEYPIGDPRILAEALKLQTEVEEQEQYNAMFSDSPFRNIPSVIGPNQTFKIESNKNKNYRLLTPETQLFQVQNGLDLLSIHRENISEKAISKIKPNLKNDHQLEDLSKKPSSEKLTEMSFVQYQQSLNELLGLSPDKLGFRVFKKGLYIWVEEPENFENNAEMHSKSFYVRQISFFKSHLFELYECGNHVLEFNEPIDGTFTFQQGNSIKTQTVENVTEIRFLIKEEGPFQFSFYLKENPNMIESHRATAYKKSKIDLNGPIFGSYKSEQGITFSLKKNNFAQMSPNGRLMIDEESIQRKSKEKTNTKLQHDINIDSEYQKRVQELATLFHGSQDEIISKIILMAKRLLPDSLMFGSFITMAGLFDEMDNPKGVSDLAKLLCQQVAIHELSKKHGAEKIKECIEQNHLDFPEHWGSIFNLMHQESEEEQLKGLFLQTLQLHNKFLRSSMSNIAPDKLFELTRILYSMKEPGEFNKWDENLENYLSVDPMHDQWSAEVNSAFGLNQKSLDDIYKDLDDYTNNKTEDFYKNQTKIADNMCLNRKHNFKEALGIGNECLQGMDRIKAKFETMNKDYLESKQKIHQFQIETEQAIQEYQNRYLYADQQMKNAIKKAKQKKRVGMFKTIVGTLAAAFFAPMLAPALMGAIGATSTLALGIAEGAIGGLISSAATGSNILKGTWQGGLLGSFGPWINNFGLNPQTAYILKTCSTNLTSTALYGGKVIPNLAKSLAGGCLGGTYGIPDGSNAFIKIGAAAQQIVVNAALAKLIHGDTFEHNIFKESLKFAQGAADSQGRYYGSKIKEKFELKAAKKQERPNANVFKNVANNSNNANNANNVAKDNSDETPSIFNKRKFVPKIIKPYKNTAILDFFISPSHALGAQGQDEQKITFEDIEAEKQISLKGKNDEKSAKVRVAHTNDKKPNKSQILKKQQQEKQESKSNASSQKANRAKWPLVAKIFDAQHESYEQIDDALKKGHEICPLVPENQRYLAVETLTTALVAGPALKTIKIAGKGIGNGAEKAVEGLVWLYQKRKILYNNKGTKDDYVSNPKDRIQHEKLKTTYRQKMDLKKPEHIRDEKLKNFISDLYREKAIIGSGSTADAARKELATGHFVQNADHVKKSFQSINFLERWLKNNQLANQNDRAVAENVLLDLKDAVGEKVWFSKTTVPN